TNRAASSYLAAFLCADARRREGERATGEGSRQGTANRASKAAKSERSMSPSWSKLRTSQPEGQAVGGSPMKQF
ncbi:MAG: hypothetical protein Q7R41_05135, partial [Phycisphaerales bacterium]|nr:hypothetical protein [Phycisphaerales bacterium]